MLRSVLHLFSSLIIGKLPNRQIGKSTKFANYQIFIIFAL